MSPLELSLATLGDERIVRLEQEQGALVEAHLHNPDPSRTAEHEAAYTAAVKRFRDHGYGKPVAAPASRILTNCNWTPAPSVDPAGVPVIPEFLQREVVR